MNPIDPRLQAALDGERDPAELPADLREAYALLISAAELLEATPPPRVSVANRVMTEIRQIPVHVPPHGSVRRVIRWFGRPRAVTLRLRPVWSVRNPGETEGIANFVGHFPGARSVEVVGSFNNWSRGLLHLSDDDHDGIWHGAAVLPAGAHEYMFVVDSERWVPDPLAGRYVDDGFGAGQENSLLFVRPSAAQP